MSSSRVMEKSFLEACTRGDEETVRDLFQQGVDINSQDEESGWSGLSLATVDGHENIAM